MIRKLSINLWEQIWLLKNKFVYLRINKIKCVSNRNIDELIDLNYRIPGIPEKAIIKEVGMGSIFIERWKKKYGI